MVRWNPRGLVAETLAPRPERDGSRWGFGWCVAVAVGYLGVAGSAEASTLYVAPRGNGSACTAAAPCGSMNAAYRAAKLGDTVLMAGGSYAGQSMHPRSLPGADSLRPSGEEITFQPKPGRSVSIDGLILGAPRSAPVEHVTFRGFTFTGWVATRSGTDVHFQSTRHSSQLHANWAQYLSYQGVEVGPFTDETGDGMQFNQIDGRAGDHILVERSRIHDVHPNNTAAHPDAVQFYGPYNDVTFRGNRLWNNDNINYRGSETMQRLVVENNFFGEERDTVLPQYYSAQISGHGAVVRYNSFAGALQPALGHGQLWEGNVMTWTTCAVAGPGSTVRYNVLVGGRRCGRASRSVSDAGFVDRAGGDLHLRTRSAAIGAGNPASYPDTDIDRQGRPSGRAPDAGADERVARGAVLQVRKRLVKSMRVRRTRRGFALRLRLSRPARVGAWVDRRRQERYHPTRQLPKRPLKAGTALLRLGRLHAGRYRVRLIAIEKTGEKSRPTLRFRVRSPVGLH